MKRLQSIIDSVKSTNVISEKDILLLKNRLNNQHSTSNDIWEFLGDNIAIDLTHQQNDKGFSFIYNLYKTPHGKIRKNCPFGEYEKRILDYAKKNGARFVLEGFEIDFTQPYYCQFFPVYALYNEAGSFSYIYNNKIVLF